MKPGSSRYELLDAAFAAKIRAGAAGYLDAAFAAKIRAGAAGY